MLNSDQHNIFIDINILQDCQYIGLSICLIDISNTPTSTQVVQETQKRAPLTNGSGNTHSRYKSNALCGHEDHVDSHSAVGPSKLWDAMEYILLIEIVICGIVNFSDHF